MQSTCASELPAVVEHNDAPGAESATFYNMRMKELHRKYRDHTVDLRRATGTVDLAMVGDVKKGGGGGGKLIADYLRNGDANRGRVA